MLLEIKNLHAEIIPDAKTENTNINNSVEAKKILKGVNLKIKQGEQHVIMGKNGSGKSTLGYVIMGHPDYKITNGQILFNGKDITKLSTDKRAKLGIYLSFQNPPEVEGISQMNFLRTMKNTINKDNKKQQVLTEIINELKNNANDLDLDSEFLSRDLNFGFSGGERKKNEILQLKTFIPKLAILDEVDSGLDVNAVKIVGKNIKNLRDKNKITTLLISHYLEIPKIIGSKIFHIFKDGKIIKTGNMKLAENIMKDGF